jgi:hypothetical protein
LIDLLDLIREMPDELLRGLDQEREISATESNCFRVTRLARNARSAAFGIVMIFACSPCNVAGQYDAEEIYAEVWNLDAGHVRDAAGGYGKR